MLSAFLSFSHSVQIQRYLCAVNYDGQLYNLSSYYTEADSFEDSEGNWTYFYHPCRALTKDDLPAGSSVPIIGANFMRVDKLNNWEYLAYTTDFNWDLLTIGGIVYSSDGQLYQTKDTYKHADIDMKFFCDPDETELNPRGRIRTQEYEEGRIQVTMEIQSAAGCSVATPSPTPSPAFIQQCNFVSRWDLDEDLGIDSHLGILDGNTWGTRKVVSVLNQSMVLFWKPCGQMQCPLEFTCQSDEQTSSAYLCPLDPKVGDCQSFGLAQSNVNPISLYGADERSGLKITLSGHDHQVIMHMTSALPTVPEGYELINEEAKIEENETLILTSSCHEADIVPIPDPPGSDKCAVTETIGSDTISLNLTTYNTGEDGYVKDIDIGYGQKATLFYQPCAAIRCPLNYSCKGEDDSTIYLCYNDTHICRSFGLYANDINYTKVSPTDLSQGIYAFYFSDFSKGMVRYECNQSLGDNEIYVENSAQVHGALLNMTVSAKAACINSPHPTPTPWHMPTPKPYPSPAPTPMKSPNPLNIIYNDTHYIVLNLNELKQTKFESTTYIASKDGTTSVHFEYMPFQQFECPDAYGDCPEGKNTANGYVCFTTEDAHKVCYPYADIYYDATLTQIGNDLDQGADLTYNSQYDTDLSISISCSETEDFNVLSIYDHEPLSYGAGRVGEVISVSGSARNVCPMKFANAFYPKTPSPTPEPSPIPDSYYYYRTPVIDNLFMEINLKNLKATSQDIVLGSKHIYRKAKILFDPDQPRTCQDGYTCLGGGQTNIWKCFTDENGTKACYGIGDSRQGMAFHFNGDFVDGVVAEIKGGYSNYVTTIHILCNESVPANTIDFGDIGAERTNFKRITLYGHSSDICPKQQGTTPLPSEVPTRSYHPHPSSGTPIGPGMGAVTGGSVFLLILLLGFGIYFFGGLIISFLKNGQFSVPNSDFWLNFTTYVATGAVFVFTCGKKSYSSNDHSTYNEI